MVPLTRPPETVCDPPLVIVVKSAAPPEVIVSFAPLLTMVALAIPPDAMVLPSANQNRATDQATGHCLRAAAADRCASRGYYPEDTVSIPELLTTVPPALHSRGHDFSPAAAHDRAGDRGAREHRLGHPCSALVPVSVPPDVTI